MPPAIKEDYKVKFREFKKDIYFHSLKTHKLHGSLKEYYAFCLIHGYRVIFTFKTKDTLLLHDIGSHDEYKRWEKNL